MFGLRLRSCRTRRPSGPRARLGLSRKLLAERDEIVELAGGDGEEATDIDRAVPVSDQTSQTRRRTKSIGEM